MTLCGDVVARNDVTDLSADSILVDIQELTYQYPGSEEAAVDSINLQIERGALFGLLGPNGAGKTTLVALLAGLRQPQSGQILIDGQAVSIGQRAVAVVPQEYAFYGQLSAAENLAYFAGVLGLGGAEKVQAIANALQAAGLNEVAQRRADTYSGGLKRRLNFAIGLLRRPQILILDEATANVAGDRVAGHPVRLLELASVHEHRRQEPPAVQGRDVVVAVGPRVVPDVAARDLHRFPRTPGEEYHEPQPPLGHHGFRVVRSELTPL